MDEKIQKAFNDTVGEVLSYLDEDNVKSGTKKAVKTAIYELCDKKIKPMLLGRGEEYGITESEEEESRGNK